VAYQITSAYQMTSAAHTWVFTAALMYWPWLGADAEQPTARFLIVSGVVVIAFTGLVVPSVGGAQWSPRFFLQAAPLLAVPAAVMALPHGSRPAALLWAVRGILAASILMQVTGLIFLRSAKTHFADVTHRIARLTRPGDVILSDVFWVPEVTATLAPTRRMLFSWATSEVPALAEVAVRHGFDQFALITHPGMMNHPPPDAIDIPGNPCRFVKHGEFVLDISGLSLSRYSCASP
ncbi:MAG TPA: hypothetical protein VFZ98_03500, partial [Vicinamibacterales bacterium]